MLMNQKAKVITGIQGITAHLKDKSKPAKDKAPKDGKPAAPASELGENGDGAKWGGLKSMAKKDINQFLVDVQGVAVESDRIVRQYDQARGIVVEHKDSEVVELGEDDEAGPAAPQDKAGAK